MGYSFRLTARVLLYAPSHRQDSTYHSLCYTSRGALAWTRNRSMGPPHEGSIQRPIAPWANALTAEPHLAPNQSWETSGAGSMKLSCVMPALVIHIHPFIYFEQWSSTSVWALSVYSDRSPPHFGGVQSSCSSKKIFFDCNVHLP